LDLDDVQKIDPILTSVFVGMLKERSMLTGVAAEWYKSLAKEMLGFWSDNNIPPWLTIKKGGRKVKDSGESFQEIGDKEDKKGDKKGDKKEGDKKEGDKKEGDKKEGEGDKGDKGDKEGVKKGAPVTKRKRKNNEKGKKHKKSRN
jgi:hypothetical protein